MKNAYNIYDLRELARRRVPKGLFEYVDRGTEDEVGLGHNIEALRRIKLLPRVMKDVSKRSLEVEVFGQKLAMPVIVSPTGSAAMLWYEGEKCLHLAANQAGIPFTMSGGASVAMEQVVEQIGRRAWFQIYLLKDESLSHKIVERAKAAKIEVLFVTSDSAVPPNREFNQRNGFTQPFRVTPGNVVDVLSHPSWFAQVVLRYMVSGGLPRYQNVPGDLRDKITGKPARMEVTPALDWAMFDRLRKIWPGALVVKGLMTAEDAKLAADHGADGVVVSNHGARNLDSAPATIEMLPEVVDAVGPRLTVLWDGGVRRGSDVVKALALGAKAVLSGRAPLYGTGAGGQVGAAKALSILRNEIDLTLGFMGCTDISKVDRSMVRLPKDMGA